MGPNHAVVTACATDSRHWRFSALIEYGDVDVMVAGGADAQFANRELVDFLPFAPFQLHLMKLRKKALALGIKTETKGFVMGEGAGVVVLEEYEHAKNAAQNLR